MKKNSESKKRTLQGAAAQWWLRYELTEEDFLLGKRSGSFHDDWENEEE